jgi:flavin reductase (DIM6/NTAB) family NADH-FMN oxidoreductase RutF
VNDVELRTFHRLAGDLDQPMLVVTAAADDGERAGCLVGFSTQCSIDPPRFLVLLSDKNRTYRVARRADVLAVHLLDRGDHDLAALFGEETGDHVDKFARTDWRAGPEGVPILARCGNWFVGRIVERERLGDHVAHLLAPTAVRRDGDIEPLTLHDVLDLDPGHDP